MEETLQNNKEDSSITSVISKDTDQKESRSTEPLAVEEHNNSNDSDIRQKESSNNIENVVENKTENSTVNQNKSNENIVAEELKNIDLKYVAMDVDTEQSKNETENVTETISTANIENTAENKSTTETEVSKDSEMCSKSDAMEKSEEDITENNENSLKERYIPSKMKETEVSKLDDKPKTHESSAVGNSLGLSLLATEYATSEESEEDSIDSDEDDSSGSSYTDSEDDVPEKQNSEENNQIRSPNDDLEKIAAEIELITNSQAYREQDVVIESDTSSSDSDIEVISVTKRNSNPIIIDEDEEDEDNDDDDDDDGDGNKKKKNKKGRGPIRTKGELLLDDLPPIEDLHITVPEDECIELGKIHSIVDQLVLVDSLPGTVPFDLDTVLFLDKGNKVLGKIFDVLGQVTEPIYCVRFNSNKQIKEMEIEIGQTVYVAPRTEHAQFIILSNLMKLRGCDASWENDIEPPPQHLDYSDDEQEKDARRAHRNRKKENAGDNKNGIEAEDENQKDSDNDSEVNFVPRPRRKRPYQQQRNNSGNNTNANYSRPSNGNQQQLQQQPQQQQFDPRYNVPNYNFIQNPYYPNVPPYSNGYPNPNPNQNFNGGNPSSFIYNPNYGSWHSNFHPYNNGPFQQQQQQQQYNNFSSNGGGFWNYQNQPTNSNMPPPSFGPSPPFIQQQQQQLQQQPLFPPTQNQGGCRKPKPRK